MSHKTKILDLGNPEDLEVKIFPAGEVNVRVIDPIEWKSSYEIIAVLKEPKDIMVLLLTNNALRHKGVRNISLTLEYIPYCRQDNIFNEGEALSIEVMANLINSCKFDRVKTLDPHSKSAAYLINNLVVKERSFYVNECVRILSTEDEVFLVSPDIGSYKTTYNIKKYIAKEQPSKDVKVISFMKGRSSDNGIGELKCTENIDLTGKQIFVSDDICDSGGTLLRVGKALKEMGAEKLYLFVSHGVFSKGLDELMKMYVSIFTTRSYSSLQHRDLFYI